MWVYRIILIKLFYSKILILGTQTEDWDDSDDNDDDNNDNNVNNVNKVNNVLVTRPPRRTARRHYHFPIFQNWHTSLSGDNQDLWSNFFNSHRVHEVRNDIGDRTQMVDMLRTIVGMQHIWDKPNICSEIGTYQEQNLYIPTTCNGQAATYTKYNKFFLY